MNNRKSLTKSLHTVTAVSRVALYAMRLNPSMEPAAAVARALDILGQGADWPEGDATVTACVAAVTKALR